MTKETAETLEQAADYILAHGWTRGNMNVYSRVCVLGALGKVAGSEITRGERAANAFGDFLYRHNALPKEYAGATAFARVMRWNDSIAKNGKEVARTLREAAAALLRR